MPESALRAVATNPRVNDLHIENSEPQRGSVNRRSSGHLNLLFLPILAVAVGSCSGGDPISPATGTPAAILMSSGDQQNGTVGTALGQDFVVRVNDASGNPVGGVTVDWAVTAGAGSITPSSDLTDANGLSGARLTLGPSVGANTATGTVTGIGSVTFNATGSTGGGGGGGGGGAGNLTFRTIDAGSYHTCAITRTELAYCWGFNQDGELGTGSTSASTVPAGVSGGLAFRQVSGGKYHSCGVTLAGDGYCWGSNLEGQLGREVEVQSSTPVLNGRAVTFMTISVGRAHSCGLALTGHALCWGSNIGGQLGFATQTTSVDTVGFVRTSGELYQRLASGGLHNCGITTAGQTMCWGFNDQGQLGTGNTITFVPDTINPSTRLVSGGLAFDSITAGYKHTCALTSAGAAYCWGDNSYGQLGDGTTTRSLVPVAVAGGHTFTTLSAGFYHTCGIATTGEAFCWGRNTPNSVQESVGGQLGDGTTTNRPLPTLVSGGLTFQSISAGEVSTCGVTGASLAYCWGDNEYGQVGTGSTASVLAPTKVSNQP
jgi:alpha-tubulin suppressor-like RCC1 family protein